MFMQKRRATLCRNVISTCVLSTVAYAETNVPLRVQLHWSHQAQFAGYYVAESLIPHDKGVKAIELFEGGPGIDPLDKLVKGEADISDRLGCASTGGSQKRSGHCECRPGIPTTWNSTGFKREGGSARCN